MSKEIKEILWSCDPTNIEMVELMVGNSKLEAIIKEMILEVTCTLPFGDDGKGAEIYFNLFFKGESYQDMAKNLLILKQAKAEPDENI